MRVYQSHLTLTYDQEERFDLKNILKLRQQLAKAFDSTSSSFLFHQETQTPWKKQWRVHSHEVPIWKHCPMFSEVEICEANYEFDVGQQWLFELRASAGITLIQEAGQLQLRAFPPPHAYVQKRHFEKQTYYTGWLAEQGTHFGFRVVNAKRTHRHRSYIPNASHTHQYFLEGQDLSGILEVEHPKLLEKVCVEGMGYGKNFGFGMLQLFN